MALKAGKTIEGIRQGLPVPSTSTSTPTPDPNALDLSAFQKAPSNQLSDAKQARWVQRNLCFCCGQEGHISCGCLNGGWKPQDRLQPPSSAWISELQALRSEQCSFPDPTPGCSSSYWC
ncbi:uncharacterized protein VP01_1178g5 [Puccinia sorghi]|uniref:CCHC-type domain-containing protein n=1 Tax=Puccinia sorghi TaxID=27349 RepID=A0A0L6VRB7_9BASI|nr:uncharacterized protein VP01_1178g5 [Puccinia sorghi]